MRYKETFRFFLKFASIIIFCFIKIYFPNLFVTQNFLQSRLHAPMALYLLAYPVADFAIFTVPNFACWLQN